MAKPSDKGARGPAGPIAEPLKTGTAALPAPNATTPPGAVFPTALRTRFHRLRSGQSAGIPSG